MKKITNKILSLLVAFASLTACMPFAACGGDGPKVDKSKAQLHVSVYNGGVGRDWLDAYITRFQEAYKDYEFIPGKKGVQVWVTPHKSSTEDLSGKFNGAKEDVYFLE